MPKSYTTRSIFNAGHGNVVSEGTNHVHEYLEILLSEQLGIHAVSSGLYTSILNPFRQWLLENNITSLANNIYTTKQLKETMCKYIKDNKVSKNNLLKFGFKEKKVVTPKAPKDSTAGYDTTVPRTDNGILLKNPNTGGDGGRSANTNRHETLTCYMCALIQKQPTLNIKSLKRKDLEAIERVNTVVSNISVKEIYDNLWITWFKTCLEHAKKLNSQRWLNTKQEYHLDDKKSSTVVHKISNMIKVQMRAVNIAYDENKWSTADIWIVKSGFDVTKVFEGDIYSIRAKMQKALINKDLIGVSLKGTAGLAPYIKVLNVSQKDIADNKLLNEKTYQMDGLKRVEITDRSKNVLNTGKCRLHLSDTAFPYITAMAYENGKVGYVADDNEFAGAGRVTGEYLNPEFERKHGKAIDANRAVNIAKGVLNSVDKDVDYIIKVINTLQPTLRYDRKKFEQEKTSKKGLVEQKIRNLCIAYDIFTSRKNEIITEIYYTATAQTKWSAPYLKLSR